MRRLNVGIAGCGVAGLACGAYLARAGHCVTIFDQWDAPSPVGSGLILQPVGLAVLDDLGAGDDIRALGAAIARLFGRSEGRVVLDVRYRYLRGDQQGLSVHRAALFNVLHDAALRAGVKIHAGRLIADAPLRVDQRVLRFTDGEEAGPFDLALDGLGARSPLSSPGALLSYGALWACVPWQEGFLHDTLEQRYRGASRMAGVLPIGRRTPSGSIEASLFWSLRGADLDAWRATPIESWKRDVLALWPDVAPLLASLTQHDDLVFARYAHRTATSPIALALAHVGDSAHCASPQLGQGANMALLDAYALSRALATQDDLDIALHEYARLRALHVRIYQAASWMFTPFYQSDGAALPFIRDRVVAPLTRLWPAGPILAALVGGFVGWPALPSRD